MLMIKNKDMESLNGQMEENIKVNGIMENNMVKALISMLKVKPKKENGVMEKELNGLAVQKKMEIKNDLNF